MKYVAFILLAALWLGVSHFLDEVGLVRLIGVTWVVVATGMAFTDEVPVFIGGMKTCRLQGWSKGFIVVPMLVLGALLVIFAPEVA